MRSSILHHSLFSRHLWSAHCLPGAGEIASTGDGPADLREVTSGKATQFKTFLVATLFKKETSETKFDNVV